MLKKILYSIFKFIKTIVFAPFIINMTQGNCDLDNICNDDEK
jgi:hypothetical protein